MALTGPVSTCSQPARSFACETRDSMSCVLLIVFHCRAHSGSSVCPWLSPLFCAVRSCSPQSRLVSQVGCPWLHSSFFIRRLHCRLSRWSAMLSTVTSSTQGTPSRRQNRNKRQYRILCCLNLKSTPAPRLCVLKLQQATLLFDLHVLCIYYLCACFFSLFSCLIYITTINLSFTKLWLALTRLLRCVCLKALLLRCSISCCFRWEIRLLLKPSTMLSANWNAPLESRAKWLVTLGALSFQSLTVHVLRRAQSSA